MIPNTIRQPYLSVRIFKIFFFNFETRLKWIVNHLDNELYSGTVADFSGSDPIIYRETLQTEQYDSLSLNGKQLTLFVRNIDYKLS